MKKYIALSYIALFAWIFAFSCSFGPTDKVLPLPDPVGDQPGQPGQNALLFYGADEWPISCYFFDPKSKDFGQNLPISNQAWVWAKTKEGQHVHAKGKRQGGFIIASGIYASKIGAGSELLEDIKTTDDMEKLCQKSIDRYYPKKSYKLIEIVASRNTLAVANLIENSFPIVIGEKENNNLITRLVIFGDSLSDTGRLKRWLQFIPERPYFLGRFSNGGVWNDFLAEKANLAKVNYSKGGAVTQINISTPISNLIEYIIDGARYFVTGSLRNFIGDYQENEIAGGKVPDADKTLFIIWAGANDFLSKFDRRSHVNALIEDVETPGLGANAIARQAALNIENEVKGLIENIGARNLLVANLFDIGITPSIANRNDFRRGTEADKQFFSDSLSASIKYYNKMLGEKINDIKKAYPNTNIILFDAEQALDNLMNNIGPEGQTNFDYGINLDASFTKLSVPGAPELRVGRSCYTGGYLGSNGDDEICKNASEMVFWDEVHLTSIAHCGLAYLMHNQIYKAGLVSMPADFESYLKDCK